MLVDGGWIDESTKRKGIPLTDFNYAPVNSKQDFVRRYRQGEFGNCSPTWEGISEFIAANFGQYPLIHLRNRVAGGFTLYNVPWERVRDKSREAVNKGAITWENLYYSAMAPTEKTVLQGEVMQTEKGLSLFYSCLPLPMREALLKDGRQVYGSKAVTTIQYYMNALDYDWLGVLFDRYPMHVVEFSTYSIEWGTLPGYRTVFWEVRNY